MDLLVKVAAVVVNLCRIGTGAAMIYSGMQLVNGTGLLSNTVYDSPITALFVIVLGLYCVFRGGPVQLFELMQRRANNSISGK